MVHPSLEGILFTPICPHSLSFRPLVFPDHVQLRVQVPESVRTNELLCSFDGSHHIALMPGDALVVQLCKHPVRRSPLWPPPWAPPALPWDAWCCLCLC